MLTDGDRIGKFTYSSTKTCITISLNWKQDKTRQDNIFPISANYAFI